MKKSGDIIIDTVVRHFGTIASDRLKTGRGVDIESILDSAISSARWELRRHCPDVAAIRRHLWPEDELVHQMCRTRLVEIEKKVRLREIRKASIIPVLDAFIERTGFEMTYTPNDNSTATLRIAIPTTGQTLKFQAAFTKILSDDWLASLESDLNAFFAATERLGRIHVW